MKYIKLWIAAICILALALCQFSAIAEGQISNEPAPVDLQPIAEPNEAPAAPEHSEPEHSEPEYSEPEYSEPEYSEPEYSEPAYSEPESPESDGDSFIESQDTQDVVPYEAAEAIAAAAVESEEYDPQEYISVTGNYRAGEETQFFYSDSMLLKDARTLSTDLAKASVVLACAAYETGYIDSILKAMKYNPTYYQYGTPKRTIENNDLVAFTIGTKAITNPDGEKFIVYCVSVKGTSGDEEWFSNFNIGKDNGGDHEGFYKASQNVISALAAKCNSDGFDPDHRIYWLTGHSRGAAVANIVAGKLTAAGSQHAGRIFAYTFACPAVSKNADTSMQNIYNFNNAGDVVTAVPLKEWGYKRFGQTIEYAMKGDTEFEARFKSLTGETFASPIDTYAYTITLVKLVPTEESLQEPKRKFALMTVAWAMSIDKGSTSWAEFASYYLKDTLDQKLMELVCGSSNSTTCISALDNEQKDYQQTKSFLERALDDTEGMTVEEFAQYQQDHYEEFKMAKKLTGIVVEQTADLLPVLSTILKYAPIAENLATLMTCANDLYKQSDSANPLAWIKHGHSCATYVLWINQRYYGYKGYYNSSRSSIDIGDNITTIGKSCFEGCSSLTGELKLPEGLTAIGEYAFSGCSGLESLYIPKSVNTLSNRCFYNCSGFKAVTLPIELSVDGIFSGCSGVETIHYTKGSTGIMSDRSWTNLYSTLEYCSHTTLKSVSFEDGIISIGQYAFYKHNEGSNGTGTGVLTEIVFPSTLESIGEYAFAGQTKLAIDLVLPENITSLPDRTFYGCKSLKSLQLPSSLTSIGTSCFSGCSGLTEVELPKTVSTIGSGAFSSCSSDLILYGWSGSCAHVYAVENELRFIALDADLFTDAPGNQCAIAWNFKNSGDISWSSANEAVAKVSDGVVTATGVGTTTVHAAFSDGRSRDIAITVREGSVLQLPAALQMIDEEAFCGNTAIERIIIPDGVTQIGKLAFADCANIAYIRIPDSVETIADNAFQNCGQLIILCGSGSYAAQYADAHGIARDSI